MTTKGYTILGWLVWQLASRVTKSKISQKRVKLGAAGVVLLVLAGGAIAAKSASGD